MEFVRRADVSSFIRCHINAFSRLSGVPKRCLYDNAKVVVLGRDEAGRPQWNSQFLDFALRSGFDIRLCRPYRAQTKGKVESGIKYVRRNFWPSVRFTELDDLNRQARAWSDGVANIRLHGTTRERPVDRLVKEKPHLMPLPQAGRWTPFLRDERRVGRDGYVQWDSSWYGVHWSLVGQRVQVQATDTNVELWSGDQRLAMHPRALRPGQRFTLPGQWQGLLTGESSPQKEALAIQVPTVEVQQRSLETYEVLVMGGVR